MTEKLSNQEALQRRWADLEIYLSRNEVGSLTVFTQAEPFFCYDADTLEEINSLVTDTLRSYAKRFYEIDVKVTTNEVPVEHLPPAVPVETVRPISKLHPVLEAA